jgi:hypothetical protein
MDRLIFHRQDPKDTIDTMIDTARAGYAVMRRSLEFVLGPSQFQGLLTLSYYSFTQSEILVLSVHLILVVIIS